MHTHIRRSASAMIAMLLLAAVIGGMVMLTSGHGESGKPSPELVSSHDSQVRRVVIAKANPPRTIDDIQALDDFHMDIWAVNAGEEGETPFLVGAATDTSIERLKMAGFSVEILYETEEDYLKEIQTKEA